VYAGWLREVDAASAAYLPAAISVGTNPTFAGRERRVEAYVLDRTDLELYGVQVDVVFVQRLRGMVTFDSVDALVEQMSDDIDRARRSLLVPPAPPERAQRDVG
jgi:riboflavin kinase/FMN adenylyltransferase